jgi:hypothetical protein
VTVYAGTSSHGQGHETAFAQWHRAVLGVAIEDVRVIHSDTALVERGEGTWGSRSLQAGGSSVATRAGEVAGRGEDARRRAARGGGRGPGGAGRRRVPRQGGSRPRGHLGCAGGRRQGPRVVAVGERRLPRAGLDVPVRCARRGGRGGSRDRLRGSDPSHRRRRLWSDPEPGARTGSAARRDRTGDRAGALRGGRLRRGGQPRHGRRWRRI